MLLIGGPVSRPPPSLSPPLGLLMGRHSACHPLCRFSNNTYISTVVSPLCRRGRYGATRKVHGSLVPTPACFGSDPTMCWLATSLSAEAGRESNDVRSLDGKFPLIRRRHPLHHTVVVEDMRCSPQPSGREEEMRRQLTRLFAISSTNGTYINEALIGKGNRGMLTHGDELSLVMSFSNRPDGTYNQPPADQSTALSDRPASTCPSRSNI